MTRRRLTPTMGDRTGAVSSALTEAIQRNMPWPYSDVGRYESEGAATAMAIAGAAMKVIRREFASLAKDGGPR